jgi:hypothetical protein
LVVLQIGKAEHLSAPLRIQRRFAIDFSRMLFMGDGSKLLPQRIIPEHVGLEMNIVENKGS